MRLYYEVAVRAFQRSNTYRLATLTGIVVNAFFGYIYTAVYLSVYAGSGNTTVAGLSTVGIISYVWLAQSLITPTQIWLNREIAGTIYSGDAVSDFSRPVSYQLFWYSRFVGSSFYSVIFRTIPTYLLGLLIFGAGLPKNSLTFLLFLLSLVLSISISFLTNYLVNLTAFWTLNATGAFSFASTFQMFLSGFLVPIAYMPDWAAVICYALPFHTIISSPAKVWLEQEQGVGLFLQQFLWLGVLWLVAHGITQLAFRKIVIQGG